MAAVLALLGSMDATAQAQPTPAPATAQQLPFDIPAQPLADALAMFGRQSGWQLSYPQDIAPGARSSAVAGSHTPATALSLLLSGTGITWRASGDQTATLTKAGTATPPAIAGASTTATLDPVQVIGQRPTPSTGTIDNLPPDFTGGMVARGSRVGVLGNRDFMNTPFSINSYTEKTIEDQQAVTVADVARNDASVRFTGQTGGLLDSFMIRGFPVGEGNSGEIALDGIYGVAPNYRLFTDYVERVEVLKGPAAFLYGMSPASSVGGTINIVPKRAGEVDLTRFTADYISNLQGGAHLDVSRRYGEGREFGIRANGAYFGGDTPLDKQSHGVFVGSLALDYRGNRFRTSLDFIAQDERINAPSRPLLVAAGVAVPSAPNASLNLTQAWEWSQVADQSLLLRAEYDVVDNVTFFADFGGGRTQVARIFGTPTLTSYTGNTTNTPAYFRFLINRLTYDAGVRATFETVGIKHLLVMQALSYHDDVSRGSSSGQAMLSNIYAPTTLPGQAIASPWFMPKISSTDLTGFALSDTLSVLEDRIQLMLGIRQQRIVSIDFSPVTGLPTASYDMSAQPPMVGLVVKPWQNISLYANYVQGLSKGETAPAAAVNAGQVLPPYIATQYEAGIKADFGWIGATLAAFQIEKPFGQLVNGVFTVGGQQRNQGLELNVFGEVVPSVRVMGGLTLLNAQVTQTSTAFALGNRPIGVPNVSATLTTEWDTPLAGLTLIGTAAYSGDSYVNVPNTQSIPAWTRFDLGASYRTTLDKTPLVFRATVQNVFNNNYWAGVTSFGGLLEGAPRTVLLSVAADF
ncbi:TonB dependent/Ligand-Gated channel TonB [Reyranella soli]|uniref:TonB dependent/Ligand-Gated channel TonB n=2 Tax=Reyranella soli TaxID=1230389 RepID=A0A512NM19_9HYPH|nr:TonB dependent/Ligand-Gated channel TonB [Reyranella soli]